VERQWLYSTRGISDVRKLSQELSDQLALAESLMGSPRFYEAFDEATRGDEQWESAARDPEAFFRARGFDLPPGLGLRFFEGAYESPTPEDQTFTIRMTRCRTLWLRTRASSYEQVEICNGVELFPHPLSPIP
jgi:hypothetical protein